MAGIVIFCMNNLQMGFYGSEGAAGVFMVSGYEGAAGAAKAAEDYIHRIRSAIWR